MPWVKPENSSRALNRDLGGEFAAAMEEERKCFEPTKRPSIKRQNKGSKKKQDDRKNPKKRHYEDDVVYSSPRSASVIIAPPTVITPDTKTKKKLSVPSSFYITSNPTDNKFHRRPSQYSSRTGEN